MAAGAQRFLRWRGSFFDGGNLMRESGKGHAFLNLALHCRGQHLQTCLGLHSISCSSAHHGRSCVTPLLSLCVTPETGDIGQAVPFMVVSRLMAAGTSWAQAGAFQHAPAPVCVWAFVLFGAAPHHPCVC